MKIGVIGAGYWGKKHVDEYSHLGHEIVVSDLSDENSKFCELNYGTKSVKDYHDILNDDEIKAVSICTPNSTHHKIAMEALNAGKNILVEKPIATNLEKADEIIHLANSKKLVVLVGHIYRFNNAIKKFKELLQNKNLGKIHTITFSWTKLEPVWTDRDILFDLGVHPIDILDYIFENEPTNVYCRGKGFRQNNVEFAIINYYIKDSSAGNNVFVNMELSWLNPVQNRRMIVVGSEKTAIVDCVIQKIQLINNQSGVTEDVPITPNNTIRDELEFFIEKIQNIEIKNQGADGEVGKRIIKIIDAAQKLL